MSIADLARQMAEVKERLEEAKKEVTRLQKEFDELRKVKLPEAMEEAGLERVAVKGLGVLSIRTDAYAAVKSDRRDEAYQWLASNGFGSVIKDYVQPSTLKALLKECHKKGEELPDDLFTYTPFTYVAITKN